MLISLNMVAVGVLVLIYNCEGGMHLHQKSWNGTGYLLVTSWLDNSMNTWPHTGHDVQTVLLMIFRHAVTHSVPLYKDDGGRRAAM